MPIMLTRKDGPPTPFRNVEYIPFYYFIPKSILSRCGAELNAIPRNPQELFRNRAACEFVESDLFQLLIIDATAFMVWPYMGFGEYMEVYSGYDPAWRFAHCPDYWIQELTDEGILASAGELFKGCHSALGYIPEWQIDIYLRYIVPNVMKKHRMDEIIQVAREYPCFEDFDFRKSNQKTDFIRKWYHTRTKHPMISLEEFQEAYADAHGGQEYEEPDSSQNVEESAVAQTLVDQFKSTLSEKDMQILELRMSGDTLEEIAEKLGYKNHSGVLKRIRKIGQAYEAYTGVDYGFENDKITEFQEKPKNPKSNLASMGIYIFNWDILKKYLIEDENDPDSENDFGNNIIPNLLRDGRRMYAYHFNGYWKDVGTIPALWEANMEVLDPEHSGINLFDENWKIYSRNSGHTGHFIGNNAEVTDSMITDGCVVKGTVKHSILFGGVVVEEGAVVEDAVVMGDTVIKRGAKVTHCIVAEGVTVGCDAVIGEKPAEDVTGDVATIAPGVTIGDRAVIGPKAMVYNDVEEGQEQC